MLALRYTFIIQCISPGCMSSDLTEVYAVSHSQEEFLKSTRERLKTLGWQFNESLLFQERGGVLCPKCANHINPLENLTAESVLKEFVQDINDTGGLIDSIEDGLEGDLVPVASTDWPDLATTYLNACKVLGVKPKVKE